MKKDEKQAYYGAWKPGSDSNINGLATAVLISSEEGKAQERGVGRINRVQYIIKAITMSHKVDI